MKLWKHLIYQEFIVKHYLAPKLLRHEVMVAYELYLHDGIKGDELIGILPERRKDLNRITKESVLNWGRKVLGDGANTKNIIIKKLRIDDATNQIFEVDTYFDN